MVEFSDNIHLEDELSGSQGAIETAANEIVSSNSGVAVTMSMESEKLMSAKKTVDVPPEATVSVQQSSVPTIDFGIAPAEPLGKPNRIFYI